MQCSAKADFVRRWDR